MAKYFETRASFDKVMENGAVRKVTEIYLVDAMSCSEAEARTTEVLKPYMSGDFSVKAAKQTNIADMWGIGADKYWLAKVAFVTIDEKTAKEKRTVSQVLVGANDFKEAYEVFVDGMKGTMADYELVSLAETKVVEVIKV